MRLVGVVWCVCAALLLFWSEREARAEDMPIRTFALIVGSNVSVDADLKPLVYADDDAANYFDLFRELGAQTYLLARLDDDTRRLHVRAASEAVEPRRAALARSVRQLAADVAEAHRLGSEAVVYLVYAGHGDVRGDSGYVTLEDSRLTGGDFSAIVTSLPAARAIHIIVDACASYFLVNGRGPGGEHRPMTRFQDSLALTADPRVGLLLSTSSARPSHEWDGFQAGVFSHELRSALYGGADADADGRVTYREAAAFIHRANAAIPNERFRPDVYAREPLGSDTLVDLRQASGRRIDVDGAHASHYWLEDSRGVRLFDFHNGEGQSARLLLPYSDEPFFLHRADDDTEYPIAGFSDHVELAALQPTQVSVRSRGPASEAYRALFALPFDEAVVQTYPEPREAPLPRPRPTADPARTLGWTAVILGTLGIGAGVALAEWASSAGVGLSAHDSEAAAAARNRTISERNAAAAFTFAGAGASLLAGGSLLIAPLVQPHRSATTISGASLGLQHSF